MSDCVEPFRHVFCDMCEHFQFPVMPGLQKGLCPVVMDEVGRKSTHARECSGFTPARRCGCCAHCVTRPFNMQGKCDVLRHRVSTGSERARECENFEEAL